MTGSAAIRSWAFITGEYPPQIGGVGAYTRCVARELVRRGDVVHIWTRAASGPAPADEPGITVHRVGRRFGMRALRVMQRNLDASHEDYRLVVQYVPQSFGWWGMNLPFCLWLWNRRAGHVWVMFHEVALSVAEARGGVQKFRARATRLMARIACAAAERVFVSIPEWADLLSDIAGASVAACWTPIPSCIPTSARAGDASVEHLRQRIVAHPGQRVLGHFGTATYRGGHVVRETITRVLRNAPDRHALLVGRHSVELAETIRSNAPEIATRVHAAGVVADDDIAPWLLACDLLVQPYPDGVSTRRTSVMAGLALGIPIVTVDGRFTESVWGESGAVALVGSDDPAALALGVEQLLGEPSHLTQLGTAGAALYATRFAVEHTATALLAARVSSADPAGD